MVADHPVLPMPSAQTAPARLATYPEDPCARLGANPEHAAPASAARATAVAMARWRLFAAADELRASIGRLGGRLHPWRTDRRPRRQQTTASPATRWLAPQCRDEQSSCQRRSSHAPATCPFGARRRHYGASWRRAGRFRVPGATRVECRDGPTPERWPRRPFCSTFQSPVAARHCPRRPPRGVSGGEVAAVDRKHRAGDKARVVGAEEQRRTDEVLGDAPACQGRARHDCVAGAAGLAQRGR